MSSLFDVSKPINKHGGGGPSDSLSARNLLRQELALGSTETLKRLLESWESRSEEHWHTLCEAYHVDAEETDEEWRKKGHKKHHHDSPCSNLALSSRRNNSRKMSETNVDEEVLDKSVNSQFADILHLKARVATELEELEQLRQELEDCEATAEVHMKLELAMKENAALKKKMDEFRNKLWDLAQYKVTKDQEMEELREEQAKVIAKLKQQHEESMQNLRRAYEDEKVSRTTSVFRALSQSSSFPRVGDGSFNPPHLGGSLPPGSKMGVNSFSQYTALTVISDDEDEAEMEDEENFPTPKGQQPSKNIGEEQEDAEDDEDDESMAPDSLGDVLQDQMSPKSSANREAAPRYSLDGVDELPEVSEFDPRSLQVRSSSPNLKQQNHNSTSIESTEDTVPRPFYQRVVEELQSVQSMLEKYKARYGCVEEERNDGHKLSSKGDEASLGLTMDLAQLREAMEGEDQPTLSPQSRPEYRNVENWSFSLTSGPAVAGSEGDLLNDTVASVANSTISQTNERTPCNDRTPISNRLVIPLPMNVHNMTTSATPFSNLSSWEEVVAGILCQSAIESALNLIHTETRIKSDMEEVIRDLQQRLHRAEEALSKCSQSRDEPQKVEDHNQSTISPHVYRAYLLLTLKCLRTLFHCCHQIGDFLRGRPDMPDNSQDWDVFLARMRSMLQKVSRECGMDPTGSDDMISGSGSSHAISQRRPTEDLPGHSAIVWVQVETDVAELANMSSSLEAVLNKLKHQCASVSNMNSVLKSQKYQLRDLEQQVGHLMSQNRQLSHGSSTPQLNMTLDTLRQHLNTAAQLLGNSSPETSSILVHASEYLENEYQLMESDYRRRQAHSEQVIVQLQQELEDTHHLHQVEKTSLRQMMNEVHAQLAATQRQQKCQENLVEEMSKEMEMERDEHERDVAALRAQRQQLQQALREQTRLVSEVGRQASGVSSSGPISRAHSIISSSGSVGNDLAMEALEIQVHELQEQKAHLEEQIRDMQSKMETLEETVKAVELLERFDETHARVRQQEVKNLQKELADAKDEVLYLQEEIHRLQSEKRELNSNFFEDSNNLTLNEIFAADPGLARYQRSISVESTTSQPDTKKLREQLENATHELSICQTEVSTMKSAFDSLCQHHTDLQTDYDTLQAMLDEKQVELDSIQKDYLDKLQEIQLEHKRELRAIQRTSSQGSFRGKMASLDNNFHEKPRISVGTQVEAGLNSRPSSSCRQFPLSRSSSASAGGAVEAFALNWTSALSKHSPRPPSTTFCATESNEIISTRVQSLLEYILVEGQTLLSLTELDRQFQQQQQAAMPRPPPEDGCEAPPSDTSSSSLPTVTVEDVEEPKSLSPLSPLPNLLKSTPPRPMTKSPFNSPQSSSVEKERQALMAATNALRDLIQRIEQWCHVRGTSPSPSTGDPSPRPSSSTHNWRSSLLLAVLEAFVRDRELCTSRLEAFFAGANVLSFSMASGCADTEESSLVQHHLAWAMVQDVVTQWKDLHEECMQKLLDIEHESVSTESNKHHPTIHIQDKGTATEDLPQFPAINDTTTKRNFLKETQESSELHRLREQAEALLCRTKHAEEVNDELRVCYTHEKCLTSALREEQDRMRLTLEELRLQVSTADSRLYDTRESLEVARNKLTKKKLQLSEQRQQVEQLRGEVDRLRRELSQSQRDVEMEKLHVQEEKHRGDTRKQEMLHIIEGCQEEILSLQCERCKLKEQVRSLQQQIDKERVEAREEMRNLEAEVQQLKEDATVQRRLSREEVPGAVSVGEKENSFLTPSSQKSGKLSPMPWTIREVPTNRFSYTFPASPSASATSGDSSVRYVEELRYRLEVLQHRLQDMLHDSYRRERNLTESTQQEAPYEDTQQLLQSVTRDVLTETRGFLRDTLEEVMRIRNVFLEQNNLHNSLYSGRPGSTHHSTTAGFPLSMLQKFLNCGEMETSPWQAYQMLPWEGLFPGSGEVNNNRDVLLQQLVTMRPGDMQIQILLLARERVQLKSLLEHLETRVTQYKSAFNNPKVISTSCSLEGEDSFTNVSSKLISARNNVTSLDANGSGTSDSQLVAGMRYQQLYLRCLRVESRRRALIYQKRYLLLVLGRFRESESEVLRQLALLEGSRPLVENEGVPRRASSHAILLSGKQRFKAAVFVVVALSRLQFLVTKWQSYIHGVSLHSVSSLHSNHTRVEGPRPVSDGVLPLVSTPPPPPPPCRPQSLNTKQSPQQNSSSNTLDPSRSHAKSRTSSHSLVNSNKGFPSEAYAARGARSASRVSRSALFLRTSNTLPGSGRVHQSSGSQPPVTSAIPQQPISNQQDLIRQVDRLQRRLDASIQGNSTVT